MTRTVGLDERTQMSLRHIALYQEEFQHYAQTPLAYTHNLLPVLKNFDMVPYYVTLDIQGVEYAESAAHDEPRLITSEQRFAQEEDAYALYRTTLHRVHDFIRQYPSADQKRVQEVSAYSVRQHMAPVPELSVEYRHTAPPQTVQYDTIWELELDLKQALRYIADTERQCRAIFGYHTLPEALEEPYLAKLFQYYEPRDVAHFYIENFQHIIRFQHGIISEVQQVLYDKIGDKLSLNSRYDTSTMHEALTSHLQYIRSCGHQYVLRNIFAPLREQDDFAYDLPFTWTVLPFVDSQQIQYELQDYLETFDHPF